MLPDTTELNVEDGVLQWRNEDFMISTDAAESIADEIRRRLQNGSVDSVLVDNRDADGTWPQEVTELWGELMGEMYEQDVTCATVSPAFTNAMQINQLAEESGTDDRISAFTEYEEALEFIEQ